MTATLVPCHTCPKAKVNGAHGGRMSIIHVCYVVCDYTGCREKYELVGGTTKPDGWTASVAPKNERVGGYQDERNWCPNHANGKAGAGGLFA